MYNMQVVDNDSINFKCVSMFIVHGTLVWEWYARMGMRKKIQLKNICTMG